MHGIIYGHVNVTLYLAVHFAEAFEIPWPVKKKDQDAYDSQKGVICYGSGGEST